MPVRDGWSASLAWKAAGATALLVVVGGLVEPEMLGPSAWLAMLPFMAILGIASFGQFLVVQQRGLDVSVAGMISLAAAIVTVIPAHTDTVPMLALAVLLSLGAGLLAGTVNGVVVSLLRVPSLVTTIGMNSVLLGFLLYVSGGTPTQGAPALSRLVTARIAGVPATVVAALVIGAAMALVIARTRPGRRFVAAGMSEPASRALGIPVTKYRIATYALAGLCSALCGILLAGLFKAPDLFCGDPYLLSTVAAVVVAGNSLTGGGGSVTATIIGAVFLTYLDQIVLNLGFTTAAQYVVHAAVVIAGVALPGLFGRERAA